MNMLAESVTIYRSRLEQNADEFWNDIGIPFLLDHWLGALGLIGLFVLFIWFLGKSGGSRY